MNWAPQALLSRILLLLLTSSCLHRDCVSGEDNVTDQPLQVSGPTRSSQYLNYETSTNRIDEELDFSDTVSGRQLSVADVPYSCDLHGTEDEPVKTCVVPNATFSYTYTGVVNASVQYLFVFNYEEGDKVTATRMRLSSRHADKVFPIMFVARQQEGILSYQLPLGIADSYSYWSVSRTLCPVDKNHRAHMKKEQLIYVTISSMSHEDRDFRLTAYKIDNFEVEHDVPKTFNVSVARPKYYMYSFPEGVDHVVLRVTSESKMCMTVSIQKIKCPVFDLDTNVEFEGKYQTMSTHSTMLLKREDYPDLNGVYIVFITKPDDEDCTGYLRATTLTHSNTTVERMKTVNIIVSETITNAQYWRATTAAFGFFLVFYVLAFILFCVCHGWGLPKSFSEMSQEDLGHEEQFLNRTAHPKSYGAVPDNDFEYDPSYQRQMSGVSGVSAIDEEAIDFLPDVEHEKDVFRTKTALYVSDLARKKRTKLAKIYKTFYWNLLTVAIFYGLPVVQLVITYQKVLYESGNEDLCYYNFDCAHPLKNYLSAFNNVYSNIGYIMLGFLFILLVRWRDVQAKKTLAEHGELSERYGIPQHFGLFYAMGLALIMEGFMSACYHVCPSYQNFQFDTSFMYIIACLIMLKIYQCRHPDINAKAHIAFFSMALIIFIAVIGVVYGSNIFWVFYALIHMLVTLILTAQIYFMGRWSIDRYLFKRIFLVIITDFRQCSRPVYPNRFCLLLVGNIVNWGFAIYGAVAQPQNFASFFLAIFIGNLLLYIIFYLIMKLWSREHLSWLVVVVILISMVTWSGSLYFFFQRLSNWQTSPAGSREGNRMCIFLSFYDSHDIWHFLSAMSMFFSFLIILLLDDDLAQTRRDKIPVF
ncbi:sid1 transmembrane family member 1 [Plakobranchus ocellatus]|uniref:Sid1 transmembrane family member 1 n=1 Tax=Plakobranchus ocellatus TaxID=259542 RepID=A0AAV4BTC2_9GAST|nr:sid1 transmembrane family member 1 [Plakobranchus ocellatus]